MSPTVQVPPTVLPHSSELFSPIDIIDAMIELKIQLQNIDDQIQALQPTFFAACLSLNTEKIERTRAVITRRLTPGQWTYSIDIVEHESLLKHLKH